jgi:signal peptidase I
MDSFEEPKDTKNDAFCDKNDNSFFVRKFGPRVGGVFAFLWEMLQIVIVATLIIAPIRYFLVQPFYVKGASMEPSFFDGEYLLINEIGYRIDEPKRGDVVVFKYPHDTKEYFIKRIIGMPGDSVDVQNGKVIITNPENPAGAVLNEEYLDQFVTMGDEHIVLNPDEYYLLGDNRSASMDSRSFGPVKRKYFVGKVWFRGLPLSNFWVFESPIYDL